MILNELQLSALTEISNVGLGHAATALSTMMGKDIQIDVPNLDSVPISAVDRYFESPESEIVGVYLPFDGEVNGNLACLFDWPSAVNLWETLLGSSPETAADVDELYASVMLEVGNILTGNFLNAIADMTNLRILATPPTVGVECAYTVVSTIICQAEYTDAIALAVETCLFSESHSITGYCMFIPDRPGLSLLLDRLGVADAA